MHFIYIFLFISLQKHYVNNQSKTTVNGNFPLSFFSHPNTFTAESPNRVFLTTPFLIRFWLNS